MLPRVCLVEVAVLHLVWRCLRAVQGPIVHAGLPRRRYRLVLLA